MELIDTHAHIYLPEFEEDLPAVLEKSRAAGINAILMPAIDSSTHAAMLEVAARFPQCLSMIGLHPCSVKEDFEAELNIIKIGLQERSFIAIGEIGLDFYWDKTFTDQQYKAFRQQITLALEHDLPIVIHSRNAIAECIEVVRQYPGLRGVFHCFSGTIEQAEAVKATGFYLGIGGMVTFKNGGLDKVIEAIGLEQVALETDAPYLAPVPFRGKRNETTYLRLVAEKLTSLTGLPLEEVAAITTQNAKNLFRLG